MSTHKPRHAEMAPHSASQNMPAPAGGAHASEALSNSASEGACLIERISYKVTQAAQATGLSRYVIYDAIRDKQLAAYEPNPGGDFLILAEDLRTWIKRYPAQPRVRGRRGASET